MDADAKARCMVQNRSNALTDLLLHERNGHFLLSESSLNDACVHLLSRQGKQLRGRLLLSVARQGLDGHTNNAERAAFAIELLHLASLAHDDVIDSGTLRRGTSTVGVRFGQRAAGYAGAWLFARATEIIADCGSLALEFFTETAQQMCEGGMRELRGLNDIHRTVDDYLEVSKLKTASAFGLSARLGALFTESAQDEVEVALAAGISFGMAYQIWDDLVDLLATAAQSGKTPESDIRHGLFTLPIILAVAEDEALREMLIGRNLRNLNHDELVAKVKRTKGVKQATEMANSYAEEAINNCRKLSHSTAITALIEDVRRRHLELLP